MSIPNFSTIAHHCSAAAGGLFMMSKYQLTLQALTIAGRTINPTVAAVTLLVGIKKASDFVSSVFRELIQRSLVKLSKDETPPAPNSLPPIDNKTYVAIDLASHTWVAANGFWLAGKIGLISTVGIPLLPAAIVGGATLALAPRAINFVANLYVHSS